MKLYHDKEYNILKDIHKLNPSECFIISDYEGSNFYYETTQIIDDILKEDGLSKWKDNSKSGLPPDLINNEDKLIMEVMRVDDHSPDGKDNPVLARQRKISEEVREIVEQLPKGIDLYINAVTDLPTEQDHNYKFYYSSFQRTVKKHLGKLPTYRKNYPNSKTIFLVLDETSGVYIERKVSDGSQIAGRLHFPFFDNRFLNSFIDSELDYLIWYIPYNHYISTSEPFKLPHLILFDIKNAHKSPALHRIDYDEDRMISNEK